MEPSKDVLTRTPEGWENGGLMDIAAKMAANGIASAIDRIGYRGTNSHIIDAVIGKAVEISGVVYGRAARLASAAINIPDILHAKVDEFTRDIGYYED